MKSSLNWLREQGIEEIETSLLKIKLNAGVQEASQSYEEKIWSSKTRSSDVPAQKNQWEIEEQYQDVISLIETKSTAEPANALQDIDRLADYYDRVRKEISSGHKRTRLMSDISSTMWTLVPNTKNFPLRERLNSPKPGERLSAYKYLERYPSDEDIDLLLSRSIGMLEVPFGQYAALLALRRRVVADQVEPAQAKKLISILEWAASVDYIVGSDRCAAMAQIISILRTNLNSRP